jgi:fumarate hydratase subunit beta
MEKRISTPLTEEKVLGLNAGDSILLSGTIYTARDAAHKRLIELINKGETTKWQVKLISAR